MNERIVTREIRLIGSKGEQLGIMSPAQGLLLAQEKDLDFTLLSSKINEICKNDRIYNSMKDNIEKIDIPDSVNIISNKIIEHLYAI